MIRRYDRKGQNILCLPTFRTMIAALPLFAWTIGAEAQAGTATANLGVNMTITSSCTVAGGTLSFGSQGPISANVDQTASIAVTCTNTTTYNVGLGQGANGSSVTTRKMKGGANNTEYINYSLFTDSGRTANWGQTVGTDTLSGTGNGSAQSLTVYGRVPPQATGSAGSYTDTVLITVSY